MVRLALIIAAAALASCGDDDKDRTWQPTPGAPLAVGDQARPVSAPGVDCTRLANLRDRYEVVALPTPDTVVVADFMTRLGRVEVDRRCVAKVTLRR